MAKALHASLLAVCLAAGGGASAQNSPPQLWDEHFFNPNPDSQDFTLPMPCGGAMVFRMVPTPVGSDPLDDRMIVLGAAEAATDYEEFVRPTFVAGGFGEDGKRFYYLAKYELTVNQAQALAGGSAGACKAPTEKGQVPATGLSWYEANDLAYKYNLWLYAHAREKLPRTADAAGFMRLPTETEWEYAARGGAAVSETQFRDNLFPMDEGTARYAWFQGTQSAGGQLHSIGKLSPNPLGFYDIIGNAAEIVLDPFHLNKVGRLHGAVGAFIIKGGDYQTSLARLRSSMRLEIPHFNVQTGGPTHLSTVGARFAIGAQAITSANLQQLHTNFQTLASPREALPDDPQELIKNLLNETVNPDLTRKLQAISTKLAEETRASKEFEARAVGSAIRSGAILVRDLRDMDARIKAIELFIDVAKANLKAGDQEAGSRVTEYTENRRKVEQRQQISLETYAHIVAEVSDDYPATVIEAQLQAVNDDFRSQTLLTLPPFASLFVKHIDAYGRSKLLTTTRWLQDMLQLR